MGFQATAHINEPQLAGRSCLGRIANHRINCVLPISIFILERTECIILLLDHLVSVTVSCSTVLLQILLCLRSTLHRLDIGIEFAPYLRQYAVDIQVSTLRDIQVEYVDKPIRSLKQVTLTGISAEFRNEAIVPWIQIFISRTYMPALRRFNFVPPKDPEQTINAEMFAREDLEIKIL